ncbi:uncharacterized protein (TIGR03067 family) [Ereboglobus sp. PH5-5]|uniref:TIGR03067 domain-containing protein n=1 Tax=Ereboglobus luteus TaxID=1796921 RepID=A0A2U8E1Y4_9BACT|nr:MULTISPECIES: hypothetical protein [Ereboglobus]AWI08796.1 hypothetical protein CKA38_05585 [Ereboglobus luteus]MDF9827389.1 uncharacterized protein (TIGR03067 family) [Ereboglobus sp. PH5-10]MDF9833953.1 uncharacterized protein (TIGR03067 family) [Ereboglobus sp. PH5-5]
MSHHPSTQDSPPSAPHAIEGVWVAVRLEYAGEAAPDMVLEKTEVIFRNGNYTVRFGGETSFDGTYSLTETHILIEGRRASDKNSMTLRGIYQLVGNRLRTCLGMDGVAPETFATKPGSQHYLGTYRRIS